MSQDTQTITLRDGRVLGYAEWGDLNGKPVFYFTSPDASRYSRHPDERILTALGIHLYTFDRPGRGLSTPLRNRTLLDWADDIREFVEQNGIRRFAMFCHSHGGIHCLACSFALPEMVSSITLVTNVTGMDDPEVLAAQSSQLRMQLKLARNAPGLLTMQWNILRFMLKFRRGQKLLLAGLARQLPERDQETIEIPGAKDVMFQSLREGLKQGGASVTDEFRLILGDWGFEVEDVHTRAFIWHGAADPINNISSSHYLAQRLPNCEVNIVPEEGNLLIYSHWHEILEQIQANWSEQA